MREVGQQRQRQQSVRDRPAEGAAGGPLRIDVNPLMILGGVGEEVDALLGDLQPFGGPEFGTLCGNQLR